MWTGVIIAETRMHQLIQLPHGKSASTAVVVAIDEGAGTCFSLRPCFIWLVGPNHGFLLRILVFS